MKSSAFQLFLPFHDMNTEPNGQLALATDVVRRFHLTALEPSLRACEALCGEEPPLDVAVLGQFKSGKSSLLNAVLGETVFPVGVVPVTAVITRVTAGPEHMARVTYLDGRTEQIDLVRIPEMATEAGNPGNGKRVAVVDVFTPAFNPWPGVRLVDTPGLGSVHAHNTEATRAWMPNVAVALVTISAERPLSDEDRRLVSEARQTAPHVAIMLTKVDLLSEAEQAEVMAFLARSLHESLADEVPVLPFSCRVDRDHWVRQLRDTVLAPVSRDLAGERRAALRLKLKTVLRASHGYLAVGLQSAQRADADRQRLRAAVLNESVNAAVIRDELVLAQERICQGTRPAFEQVFLSRRAEVEQRVASALAAESLVWRGNLAEQTKRYETWMTERLQAELAPVSHQAVPRGAELLALAEERFRRIIEAFRDRLSRNIRANTGQIIAPLAWEPRRPLVSVIPVAVSRAFMTNWDLLWWMLPMSLVGGLFRRHLLGLVAWEVTKNLTRLSGDWAAAVDAAVSDLRAQASVWAETELATLDRLLGQQPAQATGFQEALQRLEAAEVNA